MRLSIPRMILAAVFRLLAALAFFATVSTPAAAGPLESGLIAYNKGDYATALRLWRPLAERGDALAQSRLGVMYAKGDGVPQDYAEAAKWFRKAADQGFAVAQGSLGIAYHEGQGVPQDYAEAAKWFRKAAEKGRADDQFLLGLSYENGEGVPQDYVEAYKWWSLAADQGHQEAANQRDAIAYWMTPAQIAEAEKLAREWRKKHQQ